MVDWIGIYYVKVKCSHRRDKDRYYAKLLSIFSRTLLHSRIAYNLFLVRPWDWQIPKKLLKDILSITKIWQTDTLIGYIVPLFLHPRESITPFVSLLGMVLLSFLLLPIRINPHRKKAPPPKPSARRRRLICYPPYFPSYVRFTSFLFYRPPQSSWHA